MFFPLSKILAALLQPSSFAVALIALGILLSRWRPRSGGRLTVAGLMLLLVLGISPLGNILIYPLEQRFASVPPPQPGDDISGIILLGGFETTLVNASRPGLTMNESAERLTEGIRLARRFPRARVVFSGGVGALFADHDSSGSQVRTYLIDSGIDPRRIVIEDRSRNTWENGIYTRDLVKPAAGERWVLVTSAYHMPRAIGVFRKAGFDPIAHPVDYRVGADGDKLLLFPSLGAGLLRVDRTWKEWVGLVMYWVTGRSSELWPEPRPSALHAD